MKRREYLAMGALTGAVTTVGCLSWFRDDDSSDGNTSAQNDADADGDDGAPTDAAGNETAEDASAERERNTSDGDADDGTAENTTETGNENESDQEAEDKPIAPDENETEIDRDQYNQSEPPAMEERPQSDIESTVDDIERRNGRVTVTVTVRNVSSRAIDIVDVEILFYDENGRYLDSRIETITDLEAGASETVEITVRTETIRGDPAEIELEATPMDRAN